MAKKILNGEPVIATFNYVDGKGRETRRRVRLTLEPQTITETGRSTIMPLIGLTEASALQGHPNH